MTKRRPLIAGNWKMNGSREFARKLAGEIAAKRPDFPKDAFDMLVCPPFILMESVSEVMGHNGVYMGAQTCHTAPSGAHTGDISTDMLKDFCCSHVIVGHSERRTDHGETDADIQAQAIAVQNDEMCAIICVGETAAERESGKAFDVVREQIIGSVPAQSMPENTVIAYEPVWAIGTGKVATPDDVQAMHESIRATLADKLGQEKADQIRILYGGSMKPTNAKELLGLKDVDGGLIGGASLKSEDFWSIAESCPSL